MEISNELLKKMKPCPFCGHKEPIVEETSRETFYPICGNIVCILTNMSENVSSIVFVDFDTPEEAVDVWNNRQEKVSLSGSKVKWRMIERTVINIAILAFIVTTIFLTGQWWGMFVILLMDFGEKKSDRKKRKNSWTNLLNRKNKIYKSKR